MAVSVWDLAKPILEPAYSHSILDLNEENRSSPTAQIKI
jgi:hypothetical protein